MKPLFKWTGSKRKMMDKYLEEGPMFWPDGEVTKFVDAFYGAGSITCAAKKQFPNAEFFINDKNDELMTMYFNIRDNVDDLLEITFKLQEEYLSTDDIKTRKDIYNREKMAYIENVDGDVLASARLLFMMPINFNGWWLTYSYSKGRYSTAPGTCEQKTTFIDVQNLQETSQFFRDQAVLTCDDYSVTRGEMGKGTYFYFDPPYRESSGYQQAPSEWDATSFTDKLQIKLCLYAKECHDKGSYVGYSNKDCGDGFYEKHLDFLELKHYNNSFTAQRTNKNEVVEIFGRNFEEFSFFT